MKLSLVRSRAQPVAASLSTVLAYGNNAVVARIVKDIGCSQSEAQVIFEDTLRFLWLTTQVPYPCIPPHVVDQGWHTFLLFTRDYREFCQKYFGVFIDHRPRRPEDPPAQKGALADTLIAIENHLGGAPTKNWEYPQAKKLNDCSASEACAPSTNCQDVK